MVSVNWFGDCVLLTPAFKAIKQKYNTSYVAVMAPQRVSGLFEDNPSIDEVIIFDEKETHKSLKSKVAFIKELKEKEFDAAFLVHRSFTRALICLLAGIKKRIGYKRLKNSFVLTDKIDLPDEDIHRQDYYLHLFEGAGINIDDRTPQVFIPEAARESAKKLLSQIQDVSRLVGINVAANWPLKRWPKEFFGRLADRLIDELGAQVVFIGDDKESELIEDVMASMKKEAYNLCGKTTLKELAALMDNCRLFLSNDSGPAHLAASLSIPTLVLFGPTSSSITSPRGGAVMIIQKDSGCKIPCYKLDCKDNICMKNITVDEVFSEAKKVLLGQAYE